MTAQLISSFQQQYYMDLLSREWFEWPALCRFGSLGVVRVIIPTGCYVVCTCRVLARLFKNKNKNKIKNKSQRAGVEKIFKGEKIGEADFTPRTYFCKG